jgi:hypothetical protein
LLLHLFIAPKAYSTSRLESIMTPIDLNTSTLFLAILTITLVVVTFQAWRLGNEKRDIVLLGVFGGLSGVGTVATIIL